MALPEFEFDEPESTAEDTAGTAEGDGDFESDGLPDTNLTSSGGQVALPYGTRDGVDGGKIQDELHGLMKVIDEVSTGKIQP